MIFGGWNSVVMLSCSKRVTHHFDSSWPCSNLEMKSARKPARIDLSEIKLSISQVVGPENEKKYFQLVSDFLNSRLTKAELDDLIPKTIGKDNIWLHNKLILSIFSNACVAESHSDPNPRFSHSHYHHRNPAPRSLDVPSSDGIVQKEETAPKSKDASLSNDLPLVRSSSKKHRSSNLQERSAENIKRRKMGDTVLPNAPKKTADYESKFRVPPPSNLMQNKVKSAGSNRPVFPKASSTTASGGELPTYQNGFIHHSTPIFHDSRNDGNSEEKRVDSAAAAAAAAAAGSPWLVSPEEEPLQVGDWSFLKPQLEASSESPLGAEPFMQKKWVKLRGKARQKLCISAKEEEDPEELNEVKRMEEWESTPIIPPLGVSFSSCPDSFTRFHSHITNTATNSTPAATAASRSSFPSLLSPTPSPSDFCSTCGKIPENEGLRRRMQHTAGTEYGLKGVSDDAVSALETGLQIYLNQIIKSCSDIVKIQHRKEELLKRVATNGVEGNASSSLSSALPKKERIGEKNTKGVWPHVHPFSHQIKGKNTMQREGERNPPPTHSHSHYSDSLASQEVSEKENATNSRTSTISMHDLMVAMEFNPRLLGENANFQLEKISMLLS